MVMAKKEHGVKMKEDEEGRNGSGVKMEYRRKRRRKYRW